MKLNQDQAIEAFTRRVDEILGQPRAVRVNQFSTSLNSYRAVEDAARKALENAKTLVTDGTARESGAQMLRSAHGLNVDEARRSLNALRIDSVNNFLLPTIQFAGLFFEVRILQDNEEPKWVNETNQEVGVIVMNEDGTPEPVRAVKPRTALDVPLKMHNSQAYQFPEIDVYQGRIVDQALMNIDIARDFRAYIDKWAFDFTGTAGVFESTFSNSSANKQDRVYNPHSYVRTANLPAGNLIAAGNVGYSKTVLDKYVQYITKWGSGAFPDGDLQIDGTLLVPSSQASDIGTGINWTGVYGPGTVADAIQKNGFNRIVHLGNTFTTVPDNTLAADYCYARTNKPIGVIYMKPGLDVDITEKVPNVPNMLQRYQKKVLGIVCPVSWRPNAIKIGYAA